MRASFPAVIFSQSALILAGTFSPADYGIRSVFIHFLQAIACLRRVLSISRFAVLVRRVFRYANSGAKTVCFIFLQTAKLSVTLRYFML